ncbi:4-(cytidine 5'-diphospho)-2-C-methyl-D-erythritol kinase [Mycoplasmatota bacterium]|nr:4-(cytidine 5'-diphospho)-2-C-methyl-D-erythritol kinase [Mycoplasmatota bacterium]
MIIEKAPAKINLALDVLEKRKDNYHNLKMVMTTIDLYDRLTFDNIQEDKIILNSNKLYLPVDEKNLVYKVAKLIKDSYNINSGIKIFINKNIPIAAGLAGGSSDAAATIRAMNKMFKLGLSLSEMIDIGMQVGSDVPFCIYNKTAIAEGRGEIITPLNKVPKCWVVLVKPLFGVSTKEVFENININKISHPNVEKIIGAIKNQDYHSLCQSIGNFLEEVTFKLYPEVEEIKGKLQILGADAVLMSGSGPTVFGLVLKERKAKIIMNSIDRNKYETHAVRILG